MAERETGAAAKHAICLVVDRLAAGYLGAYGNTWIRTPALDRLAAESIVFDQALIDSAQLTDIYAAYLGGDHALVTRSDQAARQSLPTLLASAGVRTVLMTDDPQLAELPVCRSFDEVVRVEPRGMSEIAEDVEHTQLAEFFVAAVELIDQLRDSSMIWLHCSGMAGPWDAPRELRAAYADEADPEPPTLRDAPCYRLAEDFDPDELLGIVQCYAAQVTVLDYCLQIFLEALNRSAIRDTALLSILSARGFPTGERLNIGAISGRQGEPLYSELTHIPWLMRLPNANCGGNRTSALVQPCDLYFTLLDWWGIDRTEPIGGQSLLSIVLQEQDALRNRAVTVGLDGQWSIRTHAWYLRNSTEFGHELFAKPEDRWEVANVANRCPDVVDKLVSLMQETRSGQWHGTLDDALEAGFD